MNLETMLAGQSMTWRFRGSAEWEGWLSRRPWADAGGTIVLRIAHRHEADRFAKAAESGVVGTEGRSDRLRFLRLSPETVNSGPAAAVCASAGLRAQPFLPSCVEVIANFSSRTAIIAMMPPPREPMPDLYSSCCRFADAVGKWEVPGHLAFILMETPQALVAPSAVDLTAGYPVDGLGHLPQIQLCRLWPTYLHHRIAWETGGALSRSQLWDSEICSELALGDDEQLEHRLNRSAKAEYSRLDAQAQSECAKYLALLLSNHTRLNERHRLFRSLERRGLLCRLGEASRPQLCPWLARAMLLLGQAQRSQVPYLRHQLVCEPLARQLMYRCCQAEAELRSVCAWQIDPQRMPGELRDDVRKFGNGDPSSAARFYPTAHPSMPAEAIDFAGFGVLVDAIPQGPKYRALVSARNALAHGHYVNWRMITIVRDAERDMGPDLL